MTIESYVIRIYRYNNKNRNLIGTLMDVGNGEPVSFASMEELWQALNRDLIRKHQNEAISE